MDHLSPQDKKQLRIIHSTMERIDAELYSLEQSAEGGFVPDGLITARNLALAACTRLDTFLADR